MLLYHDLCGSYDVARRNVYSGAFFFTFEVSIGVCRRLTKREPESKTVLVWDDEYFF
mgnify:CR=1 FL=1